MLESLDISRRSPVFKSISDAPSPFKGKAKRGEYFTFQIGVFAVSESISDLNIVFSDLKGKNKNISASALTCFNLGGINWNGEKFKKKCPVEKGRVQPLWIGVNIPVNTSPGIYEGKITLQPAKAEEQSLKLNLEIKEDISADAGDSEPWRHSRLRWLNSRIAFNDKVVFPFKPLKLSPEKKGSRKIDILGRSVSLDQQGFPRKITNQSIIQGET